MIRTEIGTTTPDAITVRGLDLAGDIIGKLDFVDMIVLTQLGRLPEPREKAMINAVLVTGTDHGLTPSAIAARLTWMGAPEALQGAVAAGLLGAGSTLLGTTQNVSEMLADGLRGLGPDPSAAELLDAARAVIARHRDARRPVPGVGHPIHVHGDPRVPALRALSRQHGYYGCHWQLMDAVADVLVREQGRSRLPLNAAGAVGAIAAEMALDPLLARGLGLIARCAGLVAHVLEDRDAPIGQQVWHVVLQQDPRNVMP